MHAVWVYEACGVLLTVMESDCSKIRANTDVHTDIQPKALHSGFQRFYSVTTKPCMHDDPLASPSRDTQRILRSRENDEG